MMLGSKGILTPMIPDCSVLRTPAIIKNIHNSLIFLRKMATYSCFGGAQIQKSSCKQACIRFLNFRPWYITYCILHHNRSNCMNCNSCYNTATGTVKAASDTFRPFFYSVFIHKSSHSRGFGQTHSVFLPFSFHLA